MHTVNANPFNRADTLTGTCQAIGEDFGFHPNILRIAFALALFWSAEWTLVAYLGLGATVLASRLIFPARRRDEQPEPVETASVNDAEEIEYAEAA